MAHYSIELVSRILNIWTDEQASSYFLNPKSDIYQNIADNQKELGTICHLIKHYKIHLFENEVIRLQKENPNSEQISTLERIISELRKIFETLMQITMPAQNDTQIKVKMVNYMVLFTKHTNTSPSSSSHDERSCSLATKPIDYKAILRQMLEEAQGILTIIESGLTKRETTTDSYLWWCGFPSDTTTIYELPMVGDMEEYLLKLSKINNNFEVHCPLITELNRIINSIGVVKVEDDEQMKDLLKELVKAGGGGGKRTRRQRRRRSKKRHSVKKRLH